MIQDEPDFVKEIGVGKKMGRDIRVDSREEGGETGDMRLSVREALLVIDMVGGRKSMKGRSRNRLR
jgi:hypothetical protein